jgi:hypothetical protein
MKISSAGPVLYVDRVEPTRDFFKRVGFEVAFEVNDGGNMTSVASRLSDDDIENLAHYTANLY